MIIADKSIQVISVGNDQLLIDFRSEDILKKDIGRISVHGGRTSYGVVRIVKPLPSYFLPKFPKTYWSQIETSANEFDHFQIHAFDFERDIFIVLGSV